MSAANPYLVTGPAIISFSGGRTSAFMLHEILRSHNWNLPDNVAVCFANTGREREETLRFVYECGNNWGVHIYWLEWRSRTGPAETRFEIVGYNSASRKGEPFSGLISSKKYLPNSVARFCTEELKINTIRNFAETHLGWSYWANIIGLRYDEGWRVLKAIAKNHEGESPWGTKMPLSSAKVTKADVMAFWSSQPFDLGIKGYEGNCDLCFLKGRATLLGLIRDNPEMADWWTAQEQNVKGRFRSEYSYSDLIRDVREQPTFFDIPDEENDVECGLACAGDGS